MDDLLLWQPLEPLREQARSSGLVFRLNWGLIYNVKFLLCVTNGLQVYEAYFSCDSVGTRTIHRCKCLLISCWKNSPVSPRAVPIVYQLKTRL